VLDPSELYTLVPDAPRPGAAEGPVLVQALSGFVDAGNGVRLAREHLLTALEHEVVATFDHDLLHDYRARRPMMVFDENHWQSYEAPTLELLRVTDEGGTQFLLLTGPEPDVSWERFVTAVTQLVERLGVRLTVGLDAIPMAVPHTRPVGVTAHGTRPELVAGHEPWVQRVQVPASAGALLEYRLGERGHDAMGFAVHVPHYVTQVDYPGAAAALLEALSQAAGLRLPTSTLTEAAEHTRGEIDAQVQQQSDVQAVVEGLEQQYDSYVSARGDNLLADEPTQLPSADELGAELERFLAQQTRGDDQEG
jgi:proteasome assembly chaperone (PAC2) family protein